jgi:3-oxoacyl-[acyl-carrier protein] reductase
LIARDEAHLQETAQKAKSFGAESLVLALDLREPASPDKIVNEALSRFGRIDAVVNIAGAVPQIDLLEMTDSQWDDGMALKFHGARRLTIRAWDALKASRGSVVLLSGLAAWDPKPGFAAVAAINAAIIALAKAFAEQGIKDGVQVNSVSPGAVMTGRRRSFLNTGRQNTTSPSRKQLKSIRSDWELTSEVARPIRAARQSDRNRFPRSPSLF